MTQTYPSPGEVLLRDTDLDQKKRDFLIALYAAKGFVLAPETATDQFLELAEKNERLKALIDSSVTSLSDELKTVAVAKTAVDVVSSEVEATKKKNETAEEPLPTEWMEETYAQLRHVKEQYNEVHEQVMTKLKKLVNMFFILMEMHRAGHSFEAIEQDWDKEERSGDAPKETEPERKDQESE